MNTVTKKELICQFSKVCDIPQKQATVSVDTLLGLIIDNLAQGNIVDITGFGKFTVKDRGEKVGMNPVTHEKIIIPPSKAVKFSMKKGLREAVNKS